MADNLSLLDTCFLNKILPETGMDIHVLTKIYVDKATHEDYTLNKDLLDNTIKTLGFAALSMDTLVRWCTEHLN